LDVLVDDVETACAQIETLGGQGRGDHDIHEYDVSWRVMTDPQGNEFCLIYGLSEGTWVNY
jgi:predicted enzyme related to lactoylglutathione lyase